MSINKDWALLLKLIGSSGTVTGRTRLQKMVFLAGKEKEVPFSYNFSLYYYGPYSSDLQDAVDTLVANELVKEETYPTYGGEEGYSYTLTPLGESVLSQIEGEIEKGDEKSIAEVVSKYATTPLRDLLSYVYTNYVPSTAASQ